MPLYVYRSVFESGSVPSGWRSARNGTSKYPIRDPDVRRYLKTLLPGRWQKVIKIGVPGDVHYFEHGSGQVAGVKYLLSRHER